MAQQLLDNHDAIVRHIESGWNVRFDGLKIRQHGNFRLERVLIAKDDAYIFDFQGEPDGSSEERRRKQPPARDVASFIRSIDYATGAALDRAVNLGAEERATVAQRTRAWGERLTATYWESYCEALGQAQLWPASEKQRQALLDLFLLERLLHEIEYELGNRPGWSHIPLAAMLRNLERRGAIEP